jgi:hypothetical protein
VDLALLDEFSALGKCARRLAAAVDHRDLDIAPKQGVVVLLQEQFDAVLHVLAGCGERAGENRDEADAYRLLGQGGTGNDG